MMRRRKVRVGNRSPTLWSQSWNLSTQQSARRTNRSRCGAARHMAMNSRWAQRLSASNWGSNSQSALFVGLNHDCTVVPTDFSQTPQATFTTPTAWSGSCWYSAIKRRVSGSSQAAKLLVGGIGLLGVASSSWLGWPSSARERLEAIVRNSGSLKRSSSIQGTVVQAQTSIQCAAGITEMLKLELGGGMIDIGPAEIIWEAIMDPFSQSWTTSGAVVSVALLYSTSTRSG
mmetsp:Transcript_40322/g.105922  ORF Transcript_40322/g.105922 Transcript_40322/m.105922 type:complete len:230 (-) Transcript_40322:1713-2402(-)